MGRGMAWTAAAGPLSNVVLAILAAVTAGLLLRYAPGALAPRSGVRQLVMSLIGTNVVLALFNLIPVPPLDGSRIVDGYMPFRFRPLWDRVTAFAPFFLLGIFFFGSRIIAVPSEYLMTLLFEIANSIGNT
jgi:Zn-dependent protease